MKLETTLALVISVGFAMSSQAQILVNDTWADGNRSSSGPDGGGIDSAWYANSTANLTASVGHLAGTVAAASSASWTTYITDTFANSVNLANVGDSIKIAWVFSMTGVNAGNASQGFHMGILQSPNGGRLAADGTPASQVYAGYGSFWNIGTTLGRGNNDNFDLMEWAVSGGANAFLSASAAYSKIGTGAGANTATGYADGVTYTYQFTAARTASGLQLDQSISGGTLNGTGGMTNSFLDTTVSSFTFDTFGMRPTAGSVAATGFDTTQFEVEFIPAVPEPAAAALLGLGSLGLILARRRQVRR
jgi:hypothetical protein